MRAVARILLIMPLALIIAFGGAGFFLMLATVVSPALAAMVFGAMNAFAEVVFGLAFNGEDPTPVAQAATVRGFQLIAAILIAPLLITAIASEMFRWNGALVQMGLAGLLAMALPAALLGLTRLPTGSETQVLAAFFLTGVVGGALYWLIAGRGARVDAPLTAPTGSSGS